MLTHCTTCTYICQLLYKSFCEQDIVYNDKTIMHYDIKVIFNIHSNIYIIIFTSFLFYTTIIFITYDDILDAFLVIVM